MPLRQRAFDLLQALVEARGALVTKEALLDRVWSGLVVEESNIQVQVSGLRRLLGTGTIATIPGLGYRLALPVQTLQAGPEPVFRRRTDGPGDASRRTVALAPPANVTAFNALIGRDEVLTELVRLVSRERLVTVVGTGGAGKTRVAQDVARRWCDALNRDGAWVDLSTLSDPTRLPWAIAAAAGVDLPSADEDDPASALPERMRHRSLLLILDNCEHVVDAVAALVGRLLHGAPRMQVLATSQERLRVVGEVVYRLQPLAVPPEGVPAEHADSYGAVQLLLQRARDADHNFSIGPDQLAAAAGLVRRLDGLPLAIEMAAARVPKLGIAAVTEQLADWSRLLRNPRRTGAGRHATLRDALEWSHSLLDDHERTVLRRLAPFVGSFTLTIASSAVTHGDIDQWDAIDALAALADKSLLHAEAGDPPRYRLLETTRLLAQQQLTQHGEGGQAELAHGLALATLAEAAIEDYWRLPDGRLFARYGDDQPDLQTAFDRARARGDAEVAAVIGAALVPLDAFRDIHTGRRLRAEALHALLPRASPTARAWSWHCMASHGDIVLRAVTRREAAQQAVLAWRELGDRRMLHFALCYQAANVARHGETERALAVLAEAQTLEGPECTPRQLWFRAAMAAIVAWHAGDPDAFEAASERELHFAERAGAEQAAAWVRLKLADSARQRGALDDAVRLGDEAVVAMRALNQRASLGLALTHLGAAHLLRDDRDRALHPIVEAQPLMEANDWGHLLYDVVALLAAMSKRCREAALVIGYADRWYEARREQRRPAELPITRRTRVLCEERLAPEALSALHEAGTRLHPTEIQDLCRQLLSELKADPAGQDREHQLD